MVGRVVGLEATHVPQPGTGQCSVPSTVPKLQLPPDPHRLCHTNCIKGTKEKSSFIPVTSLDRSPCRPPRTPPALCSWGQQLRIQPRAAACDSQGHGDSRVPFLPVTAKDTGTALRDRAGGAQQSPRCCHICAQQVSAPGGWQWPRGGSQQWPQ